ncbi:MAG: ParB/RepB/Spo0J family partition protein [Cryobacterium sp.]
MAKRTGLGRGIGALIPAQDDVRAARPVDVYFPRSTPSTPSATPADAKAARPVDVFFPRSVPAPEVEEEPAVELLAIPGARLAHLDPRDIVPNAVQPRTNFDETDLAELVHSILEVGVLQPIVVRPHAQLTGKYELVMGERRLRATLEAGLSVIPAVVRDTADVDMLRDALLENLHRAQLNPLEEASAYQQLLADFGITQDELATRIGRSRPQITNTLRLLKLPEAVQVRVAAGILSAGHARAILSVIDPERMLSLADKIVNEDLSVRAAESAAAAVVAVGTAGDKPKVETGRRQAHLNEVAEQLGDRLDTRVKINLGARKGQITVDFATIGDLNRILGVLGEPGFGAR